MIIRRKAPLICSPQLGLAPNSILGGEVFDREILLGLAQKGIKAEIILPKGKPYDQNINNWHITTLPIKHFPAFLGNLLYLPYLFMVHKKNNFQILRIHQPQFLGLGCLFFKFFRKEVKLVATYHQFTETKFGLFSKVVNNQWDHIICDSQYVKNRIAQKYAVDESKITVVHNGVPAYLKPAKKDQTLVEKLNLRGKIVLLFMGLFIDRKNPLFLLDVFKRILETNKNIILIFWGEGNLKSRIIEKAKKLRIYEQIRIIDPIYGFQKNKIHNLADIFLHPSLDEGFALAPLEAMACAKPVVMTDGYSAKEVVEDKVNGFLCYSNDTNHWSKKLSELIDNQKLRKKMGQASYEKVKKEFQWKFTVEKHLEVFRRLESEST